MNKKTMVSLDENLIFRQWLGETRKIKQDKIFQGKILKKHQNKLFKKKLSEQSAHSHYFSCFNASCLFVENPICYVRHDVNFNELKKLKLGKYIPEMVLDLHGLTQNQAKKELGNLFLICQKENFSCICIIHGHGKNILKKQIPFWLLQHPWIKAFHVAPKRFGSNAAIVVLIEMN
ncbi:UPF0115 protein YfcN [Buchnera aphidicola (Eriosoma grossulariae)]|uniref:endonuclease SmrB n=1 Tax=Buchnera aphidicola TaxID=9 RepID=UPI003464D8F9